MSNDQLLSGFIDLWVRVYDIYVFAFHYVLFWGPFLLGYIFWKSWVYAVRRRWVAKIDWVMLEIKLPKEIRKTPLAMEVVNNVFYQTSRGKWPDWYFKGRVRVWFSLELVSLNGAVKFFIRTPRQYKDLIEAQIYAQYPAIEIYEVPDYTKYVDYRGKEGDWEMFGMEFKLSKPDVYPIKTYIDYHIDKEGTKEEEKTDPMTSVIEYLGALGPGEQAWIQIMIQPADKRKPKPGTWFKKRDWAEEGEQIIKELYEKAKNPTTGFVSMTKHEENRTLAIARSLSKHGFDCGIRGIYIARRDAFRDWGPDGIGGAFGQYNTLDLNGFEATRLTKMNYPWQDYNKIRATAKKKRMFDAYKRRSWFYPPYKRQPFVLNMEELATVYHFPGGVAETPTFGRVDAKKAEPPIHLPTGR